MKELCYPFDSGYILKNRKKLRKALLADGSERIHKKIAVLGGSTTDDIVAVLELFLLDNGIEAEFIQSDYNMYWEEAVFGKTLDEFKPDVIFIHTSCMNITEYSFDMSADAGQVDTALENQFSRFKEMWESLKRCSCPVIQNNFELPLYRTLGNRDAWDFHGRVNFVSRLNMMFYEYAQSRRDFFINDINYISAQYGLKEWSAPRYKYMYKYALCPQAIPEFSYNLCCIIKSIFGRNKKVLALDLDNTLWGGVIGDDGPDGIDIGMETPSGEAYLAFQNYAKEQTSIGVLLTVCSKNDPQNAQAGLNHPDCALKKEDFAAVKANWEPKDVNISDTAKELGLLPESFVLADDNPAEREIVTVQTGAAAPELDLPEEYIRIIDRCGFFEVTNFSQDDISRNNMYRENAARTRYASGFENYRDYLVSLSMTAEIGGFTSKNLQRVTQLINKSNQFNLTAKRYTLGETTSISQDSRFITLCGRLSDKFGDNGIVSAVIGEIREDGLHIDLWIMSCRVLKRDMEYAMLDCLVKKCSEKGVNTIFGYYIKTKKNSMVSSLYEQFGFKKKSSDGENTVWALGTNDYHNKNNVITVKEHD